MKAEEMKNQSVSTATLRAQDLLPAFLEAVSQIDELSAEYAQLAVLPFGYIPAHAMEDDEADFWQSEEAQDKVNELSDLLDSVATDGFYFGAHPGDGSDFAFWQTEEEEEEEEEPHVCDAFPQLPGFTTRKACIWQDGINTDFLLSVLLLENDNWERHSESQYKVCWANINASGRIAEYYWSHDFSEPMDAIADFAQRTKGCREYGWGWEAPKG